MQEEEENNFIQLYTHAHKLSGLLFNYNVQKMQPDYFQVHCIYGNIVKCESIKSIF